MKVTETNQTKTVLFGAGEIGQLSLQFARNTGLKVDFFVDNNSDLWGKEVGGLPVYAPDTLRDYSRCFIIVTTRVDYYSKIKIQLSEMGFIEGTNFWYFKKALKSELESFGMVSGVTNLESGLEPVKSGSPNKLGISGTQQKVYRYISKEHASDFITIFNRCKDAGLFEKYLVDTRLSSEGTGQQLRFEHEFIPFFTYAVEWPPVMFYEYTLFMIDFLAEADRIGLGWQDAHAFNTTFSKGRFVFFDFDTLQLEKTSYYRIQEFINYHIIILMMMSKNLISKAYLYLNNGDLSVIPTIQDISGYLSEDELSRYMEMENACREYSLNKDIQSCCSVLKAFVLSIQISNMNTTLWDGYQNELYETDTDREWSDKQKAVVGMIRSLKPKTVLDLAGNMGWYEFAVCSEAERCIVADLDYKCIDFVYRYVAEHKIKNVYPAYLNLVTPTPDYYKDTPIGNTAIIPWRKSAIERFRSELVLALAVIHHLVFSQQLSFEEVIGQLALYTSRWLIVEFMEREDSVAAPALKNAAFDWYTQDYFERVLRGQFTILSSVHSEPTRILYLCEKKHR